MSNDDSTQSSQSVDTVMKQVGNASNHFELHEVRFLECNFSYREPRPSDNKHIRMGITNQSVEFAESDLTNTLEFEFLGPSPFEDDKFTVDIKTTVRIKYSLRTDREQVSDADADIFGRVNGVYNAWPYLREFVASSLHRLGLPPFDLPLLRAPAAAQLAGVIKSANIEETDAESE